ncbi:Aldo/keto reductase [Aspergillus uvarum CBS 121591]|uniref:Aldo/keto reductase n=1 Tax=Aspergillus uvarum CBS 121591 TaxID=1448315 RepID=A0A319E6V3_9EURO|nr:Aldo/keto reductase [Aspergillus uvarum CBS 121591]PYH86802.1 Aldo/keto reductase [Aspergillus uvarum CBS 121591]
MKFAYQQAQANRNDHTVIVLFFFNARGEELERTTEGMYRPLLLQLMEAVPDLQVLLDRVPSFGDVGEAATSTAKRANPTKRPQIFLATKFGAEFEDGQMIIDSSRSRCLFSCERSLQRLGVSQIDLLYAHRLDPAVPIEETVQAMADLHSAGKIKYLGQSEVSAATLRRAHRVHPIAAVQVEYSPFSLEIESPQTDLLRTARELGVAVVAYSPLSRGILTGRIRSRADFPEGIYGCQLVLAWLLAQGDDIFPIPGTTRQEALVENVGALEVRLTEEEVAGIRAVVNEVEVLGGRYGEESLKTCFVDTVPLE